MMVIADGDKQRFMAFYNFFPNLETFEKLVFMWLCTKFHHQITVYILVYSKWELNYITDYILYHHVQGLMKSPEEGMKKIC